MNRRVFFLSGLAILAVVLNHMTSWGYTAMFWWTDRYRPVAVPNFDQAGTLPYYVLVVIRQLTVFCVPAFVFVSGFFVAYANRGKQSSVNWKMVRARITNLLIPYTIWSIVIFAADAVQGTLYSPLGYLGRFATGQVSPGYYFAPLLCQLYLLSPLLAPVAKTHGKQLLAASAGIQLFVMSFKYLGLAGIDVGILAMLDKQWLVFTWVFFFALGIVSGFHGDRLDAWLARLKRGLPFAAVVLGVLAVIETEWVYRATGEFWTGSPVLISTSLYSVIFILCFLAFYPISSSLSKALQPLATRSYGIYLLHGKVMELGARFIRQFIPWMLANQAILQPVVLAFGLGVPLALMIVLARSPARRSFPYLFG
jgi:peptidoglycan/LPS O-acetylase OafA/YrhL